MYTIELTKEQQAGYDDQAVKTGLSVQNNIQRIVAEYGDSYLLNKNAGTTRELVEKIKISPDSYKAAVNTIYAAQLKPVVITEPKLI